MSSEASVASSSASPFFSADAATAAAVAVSYSADVGLMGIYQPMAYPSNLLCGMQSQYFPGSYQTAQAPEEASFVPFSANPSYLLQMPAGHAVAPGAAHLTSAMDSCQQISHVLQCYQQGGEDSEFVRKAITSLVKKLKDKRVELDALITAITSAGKQPTCCVTIQRSLDGRLQVAGRKGVPHVVYARIWRWPNVNRNELVKLAQCQTPTDHPDCICINPYHYERVVSNGIAMDMNSMDTSQPFTSNDFNVEFSDAPAASSQSTFSDWIPGSQEIYSGQFQCTSQGPPMQTFEPRVDLSKVAVPPPVQPLDYWCTIIYYELDTQIGETFKVSAALHPKVVVDGGMDPHGENDGRFCLGALSNVHRTEASEKARIHIGHGIELIASADGTVSLVPHCKIFVRSGFLDFCHNAEYGSKVHRFMPKDGCTTVFDLRWAYMQMMRRSQSTNEAVRAQAAAVAGYARTSQMPLLPSVVPDSGVDRMRRDFCTLSISFVKGWGDAYHRTCIKETPCWVEVQLHRPLQLLDQVLKANGPI